MSGGANSVGRWMSITGCIALVACALLLAMLTGGVAAAAVAWAADGVPVNTNGTDTADFQMQMVGDSAGGAIMTWAENRGVTRDIYAQGLDASGNRLWDAGGGDYNGIVICDAAGEQRNPQIVIDDGGFAVITWEDNRDGDWDIYAQRINMSGVDQWADNGLVVCAHAGIDQTDPRLINDGTGGTIISYWWNGEDAYAQRLDEDGAQQWGADGAVINDNHYVESSPEIATDMNGGAFIAWSDGRNTDSDIFAQRIDDTGDRLWDAGGGDYNGLPICDDDAEQSVPRMISDMTNGAIIEWLDTRPGVAAVYIQKVNATGQRVWDAGGGDYNGLLLSDSASAQEDAHMASDGLGGAVLAWEDTGSQDILAQRLDLFGSKTWNTGDPLVVCDDAAGQSDPRISHGLQNGAAIVWDDTRNTGHDVYAQLIAVDGVEEFDHNGIPICTDGFDQTLPLVVDAGGGGNVIAWRDVRNANADIFAQKLLPHPPELDNMDPNVGFNTDDNFYTNVNGLHLWPGASVKLQKVGETDLVASTVTWMSFHQLNCNFDLTGAALGSWDLYVENFDGQSDTLVGAFMVENPAPDPTSLDPNHGNVDTTVHTAIAGTGFRNVATTVELRRGGETVAGTGVTYVGPNEITADFNLTGATVAADWDVYVRNNDDGKSDTLIDGFRVLAPKPTVGSIDPAVGTNNEIVHITQLAGTGFQDGATVALKKAGQSDIAGTSVVFVSPTELTCDFNLSGKQTGAWDVYVRNPDSQEGTLPGGFQVNWPAPTVTGIVPNQGNNNQVVHVTNLIGTNFRAGATVKLTKGGETPINATGVNVVLPTQITCDIDLTGAAGGTWTVVVTNDDTLHGDLIDGFTVLTPPVIGSLSTSAAYTGTTVTVTGSSFGAARGTSVVKFGTFYPALSDYTSWSNTSIQVKVPTNAYGASIPVQVVTTSGSSNTLPFYVAPRINSVSPTWGNAGVTYVTLSGTGFCASRGTSSVWFGSSKSTVYTSWTNTSIRVQVGAGAQGQAKVKVLASSCYSNAKAFDVRPVINSITPTSGPGGTEITISGSAFCNSQGAGLVCFGSTNVATVVSWKQTQIKVKVPSSLPAGAVSVKVYTLGGMSNGKTFTKS